jgi:hypothetical protein
MASPGLIPDDPGLMPDPGFMLVPKFGLGLHEYPVLGLQEYRPAEGLITGGVGRGGGGNEESEFVALVLRHGNALDEPRCFEPAQSSHDTVSLLWHSQRLDGYSWTHLYRNPRWPALLPGRGYKPAREFANFLDWPVRPLGSACLGGLTRGGFASHGPLRGCRLPRGRPERCVTAPASNHPRLPCERYVRRRSMRFAPERAGDRARACSGGPTVTACPPGSGRGALPGLCFCALRGRA